MASGRPWIVLHTRPRCEKRVAEICRQRGAEAYLPLRRKVHRYGARVREFLSPLFPGYLFCVADPAQQQWLRQNRHVANLLPVGDPERLVLQLQQIQAALGSGNDLEILPFIEIGRRVRVSQGALKGLEGIVSRVHGKTRIVLNVDMIRESVAVEVDGAFLEPSS